MVAEESKKDGADTSKLSLLETMSVKPTDDERTVISKKLSWILRHGAKRVEIDIDKDGWVKMTDLAKAELMIGIPDETIRSVIAASNKQKMRYELTKDGQKIRAIAKRPSASGPGVAQEVKATTTSGGKGANQKGKAKSKKDGEKLKLAAAVPEPSPSPKAPGPPPLMVDTEATKMRQDAPAFSPMSPHPMMAMNFMGYPPSPFGYPYAMGFPPGAVPMGFGMPGYPMPASPMAAMQAGVNQQYRGWIKSFNADKGFGFIECPEAHQRFGRDVFLHKALKGDLPVGTPVIFTVETNKRDMPQARDLEAIQGNGGKGGGKSKGKAKDGKKDAAPKGKAKAKEKGKAKARKQKEPAPVVISQLFNDGQYSKLQEPAPVESDP